jgi:hypothetical protein
LLGQASLSPEYPNSGQSFHISDPTEVVCAWQ